LAPLTNSYNTVVQRNNGVASNGPAHAQPQNMATLSRLAYGDSRWGPGELNRFSAHAGEVLPPNTFRNFAGLLIWGAVPLTFSTPELETLSKEIEFL
jgi:hypothetical protein